MKYLIGLLLFGTAGIGLYYYIDKKKALSNQGNISVNSTKIEPGVLSTKFIFDIDFINPSNANETIDSFTADVAYNNIPFGKINYLNPIHLTPQGRTNIKVELDESNIDLIKNLPGLLTSSLSGVKIILDGYINTSLGAFPFTKVSTIV